MLALPGLDLQVLNPRSSCSRAKFDLDAQLGRLDGRSAWLACAMPPPCSIAAPSHALVRILHRAAASAMIEDADRAAAAH